MMNISTIIFDMDGVIVDSEPVHQANERALFEELGLEITEEEHSSYIGTSAMDAWKMIIEKHQLNKTPEELLVLGRNRYLDLLKSGNHVHLVEGSVALIDYFIEKGLGVLVASSASRKTVLAVLEHFGIRDRFSVITSATDIERSKPAPDIFLKAAEWASAKPGSCLVIEDSTNGIKAAKAAGMLCIGYQNTTGMPQDLSGADHLVRRLRDIDMELIGKLSHPA